MRHPLHEFELNGFAGPFTVYSPPEAKVLLHEMRTANQDRSRILFDNPVNYDRHFDIPELARHISHPAIIEMLRPILGPNILCWRSEFFPKFPGTAGTEWHQVFDYRYASGVPFLLSTGHGRDGPLDLTVWTAFTDTGEENGCMKFLPGTHGRRYFDESRTPATGRDRSYRPITSGTNFFGYNFEDFKVDPEWIPDESAAVSVPMIAGEAIFFTARCVHGSHANTTKRSTRFAIASRYCSTSVRVYPELQRFDAHGSSFDLSNYGCVLVSGEDRYGHNRVRATDNHGRPFRRETSAKELV